MKSFAIMTLGCKVNGYESESYYQGLIELGYKAKNFEEVADIYIINTCTVTNTASSKSRKMINRCRKLNPNAFVCVVGCYVQSLLDKDQPLGIDLVIGSKDKNKLVELVANSTRGNYVTSLNNLTFEHLNLNSFKHTRAYLKIQDGCNQFCSYCIIPYVRGNERSLDFQEVINSAKKLTKKHHEIVLAGIHTGRYFSNGKNLEDLLSELMKIDDLKRIRLSSIEITEITDGILSLIKENNKIAKHLHIPLQSGDDKVLKSMNRPYTTSYFNERLSLIRREIPNISISTDVIVGYPSEDTEKWNSSLNFIKSCNFSFIHVFPFSKREQTTAYNMKMMSTETEKKERVKALLDYSNLQLSNYAESFIGKKVEVIIEEQTQGYSSEYLKVHFSKTIKDRRIVEIMVKSSKDGILLG